MSVTKFLKKYLNKFFSLSGSAYFIFIPMVILWLFPIVGIFLTSLKPLAEIQGGNIWTLPTSPKLETYAEAWNSLWPYFRNNIIITSASTLLAVFLASLAAYGIGVIRSRLSDPLFYLFVFGIAIPFPMLLVPFFQIMRFIGLYDTYYAQILTHIACGIPLLVFIFRNFALTVRGDLIDSAKVDGCSEFGVFRRIFLPSARPIIITILAFQFIWIWNTLLWGLVLATGTHAQPLTVGLLNIRGIVIKRYNVLAAASIISFVVPMILFLFTQKYLYKGFEGMSGV